MDDVDLSASFSKEAPEGVGKLHLDGLSNGQVRFCRCRFPRRYRVRIQGEGAR
jgi:hypothetical protein